MDKKTKAVIASSVLVVAAGAIPALGAGGDDAGEREVPITGTELERASAAALEHVGQGKVTETEIGDEESYYEVEVTLDDGTQLDVQLDKGFAVVGTESDGVGGDDLGDDGDR
ncbi:MAG TPA: hypothetical protein VIC07_02010 [Acidimicrobiia bacterium]